jgi:hypothetical protein
MFRAEITQSLLPVMMKCTTCVDFLKVYVVENLQEAEVIVHEYLCPTPSTL